MLIVNFQSEAKKDNLLLYGITGEKIIKSAHSPFRSPPPSLCVIGTDGIPAYAAATFVAYSRVKSQKHHLYDVIAGGGIGFLSSYLFTTPYKGWNIKAESDGIYYGLKLSRIW